MPRNYLNLTTDKAKNPTNDDLLAHVLETAPLPDDAVEVARVLEPWGVQGWFKLQTHSNNPQAIFGTKHWYFQRISKANVVPIVYFAKILQVKSHGERFVVQLEGLGNRNQALALKNSRVYIPRKSFPTPDADEYYWQDLIGCQVITPDHLVLGQVFDLLETGAHAVLVVHAHADLNFQQDLLIPFVNAYILDVNIEKRTIITDWELDYSV